MKKFLLGVFAIVCTVALSAGVSLDSPDLPWNLGQYGKIEMRDGRRYLVVKVPSGDNIEKLSAAPSVRLDLRDYASKTLRLSIKIRAKDVSYPPAPWFGVKFMLNYLFPDGLETFPGASFNYVSGNNTSFDWQEYSFLARDVAPNPLLYLGLQQASGEVEYDLSSFGIIEEEPFLKKTNQDHQAIYTKRVTEDVRRRGFQVTAKMVSEDDLKRLQDWHANLVRYQIDNLGSDDKNYFDQLEKNLKVLDQLLAVSGKYGIKVVVDLHQLPGGNGPKGANIFFDKKYQDQFLQVWRLIAQRYRGNENVWAYDLMNEPAQRDKGIVSYWDLQKTAAEEIRAIDPEVPIIVTSILGSPSGFDILSPLKMSDIIYTVHCYDPLVYTHQGIHPVYFSAPTVKYPTETLNRESLQKAYQRVRQFQLGHNARIYVGEFSVVCWAEGGAQYLRDSIALFEQYNWDWTYHAYLGVHQEKPWAGWSLEHTRNRADSYQQYQYVGDTDRKKVVLDALKKNLVEKL